MKKILSFLLLAVLLSMNVLAGGYKHGGYYVLKGAVFFVGVFLASVIFWWTYLWMVVDKGRLLKK